MWFLNIVGDQINPVISIIILRVADCELHCNHRDLRLQPKLLMLFLLIFNGGISRRRHVFPGKPILLVSFSSFSFGEISQQDFCLGHFIVDFIVSFSAAGRGQTRGSAILSCGLMIRNKMYFTVAARLSKMVQNEIQTVIKKLHLSSLLGEYYLQLWKNKEYGQSEDWKLELENCS